MLSLIKKLIKEGTRINVAGVLIVLAVGALIGAAFAIGKWEWGLILLFGSGFIGLVIAWIKEPKEAK